MTRSLARIKRKLPPPPLPPALMTGKPQPITIKLVGPIEGEFFIRMEARGFASEDEGKAWADKLREVLLRETGGSENKA